jgi:DNA uptake protein ComE-like DNA-binding protein
MSVVLAPRKSAFRRRPIPTLLAMLWLLVGCQPEPIQLLPLPPGVHYPWRLSPAEHAVLEAQARVYQALEQGDSTQANATLDPANDVRSIALDSAANLQATAALPIDGSSTAIAHWDFGLSDLSTADSTASDSSVPSAEPTSSITPSIPGSPIELNTATQAELESLPRVGPAMAERIIAARPYRRTADLRRVRGIGDATWELLQPLVTVDAGHTD